MFGVYSIRKESKPKWVLTLFCGGGADINKKSIKKLEKIIVVLEKSGILYV